MHFKLYELSKIVDMDETSIFFEQSTHATIDNKRAISIEIPSTGYESTIITCILAINGRGKSCHLR